MVELTTTTISIIQHLIQAYETLKDLPKQLEGNKRQLNELLDTLEVVRDTKVLQTDRIADQVKAISEKAGDVQARLNESQKLQLKKVSRRYLRVLFSGPADAKELLVLFQRLDSAKAELALRIQIIHVSITGSMQESITHTMESKEDHFRGTVGRRLQSGETVSATTTKETSAKPTKKPKKELNDAEKSGHNFGAVTTNKTDHHAGDENRALPEGFHHSNNNAGHNYKSINASGGLLLTGNRNMGPEDKSIFDK